MNTVALILSFLLSLLPGGCTRTVGTSPSQEGAYTTIAESPSTETDAGYSLNREICITAVQGYTFAGNSSTSSVSVRSSNSGRRTSEHTKSTHRIVKSGKVVDNNSLHQFLAAFFVTLSGTRTSGRYLHSICRLRL